MRWNEHNKENSGSQRELLAKMEACAKRLPEYIFTAVTFQKQQSYCRVLGRVRARVCVFSARL